MGYVSSKCPHCGNDFNESCNAWVYGSPIRKCPSCGKEFLDKRWHEVAIEGFEPKSRDVKFYIKGLLIFLVATLVFGAWIFYDIKVAGVRPAGRLCGTAVICALGTVMSLVLIIRSLSGYEKRENQKYLRESEERLQDGEYVKKLNSFGYSVPERYRDNG